MKQKEKIGNIIEELDNLGKKYNYRDLETALVIWLRGDLSFLSDEELEELDNFIYNFDYSLLNEDLKDYIDSICY